MDFVEQRNYFLDKWFETETKFAVACIAAPTLTLNPQSNLQANGILRASLLPLTAYLVGIFFASRLIRLRYLAQAFDKKIASGKEFRSIAEMESYYRIKRFRLFEHFGVVEGVILSLSLLAGAASVWQVVGGGS